MDFKVTERIQHPIELVYMTYRDRLLELAPFLPNVDSLERLEAEPLADGLRLVNRWNVGGAVPRVARPFLDEEMLTYLDHAHWRDPDRAVDWWFEIGVVGEAVDCRGTNYFRPGRDPDSTEVTLTGHLQIDLSRIRHVPRLFHGLARQVESFILGRVQPNLLAVSQAVGKLLDQERRPR